MPANTRDHLQAARGLVTIAKENNEALADQRAFLVGIISGKWTVTNEGYEVTQVTENGTSVTATIGQGMSAIELMGLAQSALDILDGKNRQKRVLMRFH